MKDQVKVIVTTTINKPTEALEAFAAKSGWEMVVVQDQKTPQDKLPGVAYLSCKDQERINRTLSDAIGWNCIQRRNFGFWYAVYEMGADIIATVDDDNIPLDGWGENLIVGAESNLNVFTPSSDVFDPISVTNHKNLWHRGFPIQRLQNRQVLSVDQQKVAVDVQADFWNGDPDIDAICRMEHAPDCQFSGPFPFSSTKPSPFNSQNTFITRKVVPHYFMFPEVGRMDDIWASYHVQKQGFKVAYGKASVVQKRNAHNLTKDFKHEISGYLDTDEIIKRWNTPSPVLDILPVRTRRAFELYQEMFK